MKGQRRRAQWGRRKTKREDHISRVVSCQYSPALSLREESCWWTNSFGFCILLGECFGEESKPWVRVAVWTLYGREGFPATSLVFVMSISNLCEASLLEVESGDWMRLAERSSGCHVYNHLKIKLSLWHGCLESYSLYFGKFASHHPVAPMLLLPGHLPLSQTLFRLGINNPDISSPS